MIRNREFLVTLLIFGTTPFFLFAQNAVSKGGEASFLFKFETNHPLIYSIETKINTDTSMNSGLQNIGTHSTVDVRFKAKLTATEKAHNGITTVHYEPYDVEVNTDVINSSGHIKVVQKGMQVKGTQNGIVLFDTTKNMGMSQAKKFKNEMLPVFLSGYMDFDPFGGIREFHGDLPFIDFWNDAMKSQIGFFGIVFPERRLAVGDSWQKIIPLTSLGPVKLDGDGVLCTNTFTRELDFSTNGVTLANFNESAPLNDQDLTGYLEQLGQNVAVNLSNLERDASGTLCFDQKHGDLSESSTTGSASFVMATIIEGRSVTGHVNIQVDMHLKLLSNPP
jgi:hypothetical protein